ncbi:hypothetical protein RSAG8_07633, partial [Rhizoctonia solani AG-8 WAC10335]
MSASVAIRESVASSFISPSQRPSQRPTRSWCEVCRVVRNLKPNAIICPIVRSVVSWAEHWYGTRTVALVNSVPPFFPPLPPAPPPPPPTSTLPEDLPGAKTLGRKTPAPAIAGGTAYPTRAASYGFTCTVSAGARIAVLSGSMIILCMLVLLQAFCRSAYLKLPPSPIDPLTPVPNSTPILPWTPILTSTPIPALLLGPPSLPFLPSFRDHTPLPVQSLPLPAPAIDFHATHRLPLPLHPLTSTLREVPIISYGTCLQLFDAYTHMTVVQTDITGYHVVPGLSRHAVFEASTESFVPEFQMFSEAESRVVDAIRCAQNMVRAMYAQVVEGTIEVDVRVAPPGAALTADADSSSRH